MWYKSDMASRTEREKGILALVLLALVFASMGIFVRYLQYQFTVLQFTYLRIFVAFLMGLILFKSDLNFKKLIHLPLKEWLLIFLRGISLYVIAVPFISQAYLTGKYSNVSFVSAFPLMALLGFLLLKEKLTLKKVIYVLLGFIGVVFIAVQDYSNLLSWGEGELLALISCIFFDISYIARKWQKDYLSNKEITVLIFFVSSILLFGTSLFMQEGIPHVEQFSGIVLLVILASALFNVANLFLTNYGFQRVEAVLAGNLLTLEVVFALLFGISLYQEIPSLKEIIGGLLIILSIYQMNKLEADE